MTSPDTARSDMTEPDPAGDGTTGSVVVIGGGLAGIAAAIRCADAGRRVTLLETKPRLGGLTYSFDRDGRTVDNGQHVFLRCCAAYLSLLDRLGVRDQVVLQPRLDILVRAPKSGRQARLRRTRLPAPAHLAGSLLRYRLLSLPQRLRFVRAALSMRALDRHSDGVDDRSFADWLAEHRQDAAIVDAMWDLVGVATLNARPDRTSLRAAAMVFQVGLLTDAAAADIGWAAVPLQRLHGDAAMRALPPGTVRTGQSATAITPDGTGWRVRLAGNGHHRQGPSDRDVDVDVHLDVDLDVDLRADSVIIAVPPGAAEKLLPAGAIDLEPGWSARLPDSPIINVHVVFDRPVMREPFVAGAGTPIQWVFDRTAVSGDMSGGQYVAVSVSAADEYIDEPVATLRERLLPELIAMLPGASQARVVEFFVTRERHATFRPEPGTARFRAKTTTSAPGLFIAGAWTDTGWPATMEGAVRSGDAAAAAVLARPVRTGVTV